MVKTKGSFSHARIAVLSIAVMLLMSGLGGSNTGLGGSNTSADEPIVGLWLITVSASGYPDFDNVFSGWTKDGLEFDQDTLAPILTGYVCYGHWIRLKDRTYALTHPYFEYDGTTGKWNRTSGYFNYVVTVSKDGKTFAGKENGVTGVPGHNPYVGTGTAFSGVTLSATKIKVDKSLLP
jgi:hypothetical protein